MRRYRKILSVLLVCSMLGSIPTVKAFAEEEGNVVGVCDEMEKDAAVDVAEKATAEESAPEQGRTETEDTESTATGSVGADGVETETDADGQTAAETDGTTETVEATERDGETAADGETFQESETDGSGDMDMEPAEEGLSAVEDDDVLPAAETVEDGTLPDAELASENAETPPTSGTCGENLTWTFVDGTLTISGTGEMKLPRLRPWHLIDNIKKIVVQDGVTSIDYNAFESCINLTEITIPNSVTSIGDYAFYLCMNLTGVYISSIGSWCDIRFGNTDGNPLCYGANLYVNGNLVKDIAIPNSVTSIGRYAFYGCSSLTSVTIPDSVTSIGQYAFSGCSSLTSVTIPDSVTSIGKYAFANCSLTGVTIPNSVTSIGEGAFSGCNGLTSVIISDNVAEIEDRTFYCCSSLTEVTIPNSVTSIGHGTFSGCSSLTSVTIPNSVTSIGYYTFSGCSSLTSVTIPDSVTSIGREAFAFCTGLTSVIISDHVAKIEEETFRYCSSLTEVTIPNSVTSIDDGAFRQCFSLTRVTIPNSVTSIGWDAFSSCSLTSVTIPNSVTSIGRRAFAACTDLTSVIISDHVTKIEEETFNMCISLTEVTLPNSVTSIDGGAFRECRSLTKVTIPNSVTSIDWSAFRDCNSLTEVTLSNSMTKISGGMFYGCNNLTEVTIPKSITLIEANAFLGTGSLSDVYYGGSESDWQDIDIRDGNAMLAVATKHFNSAGSDPNDTSIRQKRIAFYSPLAKRTHTMTMYWGWDTFLKGSSQAEEDYQLAEIALALSGATERSQQSAETMLQDKLGFNSDLPWSQNYDKDWYQIDQPGVTFGHKCITDENGNDQHIFAIVVRGTDGMADILTDIFSVAGSFDVSKEVVYKLLESYIEGCKLNPEEMKGNVKFFVTGHSLGGIVANGVAEKLNRSYGAENVFAYTFASPRSPSIINIDGNRNIHNILNVEDIVPQSPSAGGRHGDDIWFHRDDYGDRIHQNFYELTNGMDLGLGMADPNIFGCRHSPEIYMSFLMVKADKQTGAPPPAKTDFFAKLLSFKCPVDVEIYADNADGNQILVGQIKNNQADNTLSCGMYTYVDGDKKYAYLLGDGEYTVKLHSTGEGTLTYTVQEIEVTENKVVAEKVFANVALTDGKEMTSSVSVWDKGDVTIDVSDKTDTPDVRLLVLDQNGEPDKEVLADGNGTEVPFGTVGNYGDVEAGDIPSDGNIPQGIWVAGVKALPYTGTAVKQSFRIYDNCMLLQEGRDYTVAYKNNTKAYEYTDSDYMSYQSGRTDVPAHTDNGHYYDGFHAKKAPQVVIKMKGNYTGTRILYFNITRPDIGSGSDFAAPDIYAQYNKKKQTPAPSLTWNGKQLKLGVDFSVKEYDEAKSDKNAFKGAETGETKYPLTLVGKGNFAGTCQITLTVIGKSEDGASRVFIGKVKVSSIPDQVYREGTVYTLSNLRDKKGNAFQVTLKNGSYTLKEGTDYEVSAITNNDKIGTASVTLHGLNHFVGDKVIAFQIVDANSGGGKYPLTGTDITINQGEALSAVYLKGGAKPRIVVTYAGRTLAEGRDYTVKYANNNVVTESGTKKLPLVTITGKGAFTGKVSKNYTITRKDFSDGILILAADKAAVSKANQYAAKITLKDTNGKTLKAGTDYDSKSIQYYLQNDDGTETLLTNQDNPKAGSRIRVAVTAKGNYSGSISATYRIMEKGKDINNAKIQIKNQEYSGKPITITDSGQFKTASLKVGTETKTLVFGSLAAEDVDFVAVPGSYEKNINRGTAKVTFHGVGQYGGYKTVTYKIGAKSIGTVWEGIWNKITNILN